MGYYVYTRCIGLAARYYSTEKNLITMPMMALRGTNIFPQAVTHFDIGRDKSILAVERAMADNQRVFLVAQKDASVDNPAINDLYDVGVVANIKQLLKLPGGGVRILVEGLSRGKLVSCVSEAPFLLAEVRRVRDNDIPVTDENEALVRIAKDMFDKFFTTEGKLPAEAAVALLNMNHPGALADIIALHAFKALEDKQNILATLNPLKRLGEAVKIMQRETELMTIEHDIRKKVKESIDRNQKDYYLREQMKVIQKELSVDGEREDIVEYKTRIKNAKLSAASEEKLLKEVKHLSRMGTMSQESNVIMTYLDTVLDLPWNKKTPDSIDLKKATQVLDDDHYGLKKVKERILEQLAVIKLTGEIKGPIICLVGPPGVGKTSVAASIAKAMGRSFARISMGGVRDEAEIRGHRKTYVGAMPGRIIQAYIQAKSTNPLILLDEIDKISGDYKGDPAAALLEVLDSAQNSNFCDHYVEIPFDLSKTLFIATANTVHSIHPALYDRMEIIDLSGYTEDEKVEIANRHLIPNQLKNHGLKRSVLKLEEGVVDDIIEYYTKEAGVRTLDRSIAAVCRKAAARVASGDVKTVKVTKNNLNDYLGNKIYLRNVNTDENRVGIATGLAWTAFGGDTLDIEVNLIKGKGHIELTGNLGEVMKESAMAALSYVKANADMLGINADIIADTDIHLHVPEGAVPKDGPSAGITIATALVSALTGRATSKKVAMTGEITIRGRVLPIGGLKEKSMGAYRSGVKTIIIPCDNVKDLDEVPKLVKDNIQFIPCDRIEKVLSYALEGAQDNKLIIHEQPANQERSVVQ